MPDNNHLTPTIKYFKSRDNPQTLGYRQAERDALVRAYEERSSLRGLTRTFGVARNTVSSWLKKR